MIKAAEMLLSLCALFILALYILTLAPLIAEPIPALKAHGQETAEQKEMRARNPGNLVGHGGPVKAIKISPSGKYALTGSFDYAMIHWDISGKTPKILHRFDDHDAPVSALAFADGESRALAAADDGTITLWNLENKTRLHRFKGHQSKIVGLAVSANGKMLASASWDRTARLWNLQDLTSSHQLASHHGPVNAVAFAPFDGREVLYTASYDGKVRRWDILGGELERQLYTHGWGINVLLPIQNGAALAFGSLRGETGLIDTSTGAQTKTLPTHNGPVLALAKSQDDARLVFAGGDGAIRVWSLKKGELIEEYQNPYGPVWALALQADGKSLYHGGLDDFASLWQITPRQPFEAALGKFPRRFQRSKDMPLGERQFARKCSICHTLSPEGGNRAGPTLYGLFGRKAGTVKGYAYSKALKKSAIVWNEKTISALFERGPDNFTPGSKMPLQKIPSRKKRDALIAYLKSAYFIQAGKEAKGQPSADARKEKR